jgi:hypothetical protein
MALVKVKDWNPTDPGKVAQAVVWAARGSDGEAYILDVDEVAGGLPIAIDFTNLLAVTPASLLVGFKYDAGVITEAATSTTIELKTGGIAGTLVKTVTLNWTNTDKDTLANFSAV